MKFHCLSISAVTLLSAWSLQAANIFTPGDTVFGGKSDGTDFVLGVVGTAQPEINNWPAGEPPSAAINGVGQKYLNFGKFNTGILVVPSFNGGNGSIVTSMTLWTANDSPARDPASYEIHGSTQAIGGDGPFPLSGFTLISSGALALPETRNAGGESPLLPENSQTVAFANSASYTSYLILFPTVKDGVAANSMQIAEIQLDGVVPEPASAGLAALGLGALLMRRRARRHA